MGKPHHNLEVWKRSLNFVTKIYKITANFPAHEKFGLVSQMRRAAVSIPSNIAGSAPASSP
jgi:four helix bundle protein